MPPGPTRITILQTGDYAEAWHRFSKGGQEVFRDQRHSVYFVESLSGSHDITIVARCGRLYDEQLKPGLRAIGITHDIFYTKKKLRRLLTDLAPDILLLHSPNRFAVEWAALHKVRMLPAFADNFSQQGIRSRIHNWRLGRALQKANAPCVANHSLEASKSLRFLGINASKIVPWEHCHLEPVPEVKIFPSHTPVRALYVGVASEAKGLGDSLRAIEILRQNGANTTLTFAGPGDCEPFIKLSVTLGVRNKINFLGLISSDEVRNQMRQHDIVLVPSRHSYAEGLPNTIFEALASRTPLITSDHPAFASRLRPNHDSLQFPAGDPLRLAQAIEQLMNNQELYDLLSSNSAAALASLYVGKLESTELIKTYLNDPDNKTGWVFQNSLVKIINDLDRS